MLVEALGTRAVAPDAVHTRSGIGGKLDPLRVSRVKLRMDNGARERNQMPVAAVRVMAGELVNAGSCRTVGIHRMFGCVPGSLSPFHPTQNSSRDSCMVQPRSAGRGEVEVETPPRPRRSLRLAERATGPCSGGS